LIPPTLSLPLSSLENCPAAQDFALFSGIAGVGSFANFMVIDTGMGMGIGIDIGRSYKSDVLIVEESINADQYIQSVDQLELIDVLDQRRGPFRWIFQQDGARITHHKSQWIDSRRPLTGSSIVQQTLLMFHR
jgi:hypothetical protein